jgi:hypothetical protein
MMMMMMMMLRSKKNNMVWDILSVISFRCTADTRLPENQAELLTLWVVWQAVSNPEFSVEAESLITLNRFVNMKLSVVLEPHHEVWRRGVNVHALYISALNGLCVRVWLFHDSVGVQTI